MIRDIPGLLEEVTREIHNFTDMAVVGLSGGADSTLVAILCMLALGKESVYGIHMPYDKNDMETFNKSSKAFAKYIGIAEASYHIGHACKAIVSKDRSFNAKKVLGNVKARVRMTTLYLHCEILADTFKNKKVRVMGTGNLSENYIGYFTKFGDGGVDIEVIGSLFKSEVYQLLDYFKDQGMILEEHINRVPSAGLWPGQEDEDEIGHTYNEMELAMKKGKDTELENDVERFVFNKHNENLHKLTAVPSIFLRIFCED